MRMYIVSGPTDSHRSNNKAARAFDPYIVRVGQLDWKFYDIALLKQGSLPPLFLVTLI